MADKTFEERKKIIYDFINDPRYVPMKQKELAIILQVEKRDREELNKVLDELLSEGKISLSKRGRYGKAEIKKVVGVYTSHAKGFGFVSVEDEEQDIFIGENDAGDAFLGDTVEVVIKGHAGKRPEGVITKVLSHGLTEVIGTFERSKNFGFVVPDNQRINHDIFIPWRKSVRQSADKRLWPKSRITARVGKIPRGRLRRCWERRMIRLRKCWLLCWLTVFPRSFRSGC